MLLGLFYLGIRRHLHDKHNLINVRKTRVAVRFGADDVPFRTTNGMSNDLSDGVDGAQGTFFGRNMPPVDQKDKVYSLTNLMIQDYKACMVQILILFKVICS